MRVSLDRVLRWGRGHEDLLRLSVAALLPVALLEAVLGRALSRATPLIPRTAEATAVFAAIGQAGVFLFDLGFILVVLVLTIVLWSLVAGVRRLPAAADSIGPGAILLVALTLAASGIREAWLVVAVSTVFLLVAFGLLAAVAVGSRGPWPRAFAALAATAYVGSRYYVVASVFAQMAGSAVLPPAVLAGLRIAEGAAVLAPIALFAAVYLPHRAQTDFRIPVLLPSLATGIFVLIAVASPAITAAITEAALGFRLFLPLPLYALGLWLVVSALLILWRQAPTRGTAHGIALVMLAGIDLLLTYHVLLAVAGLLLWALREQKPEPTPAATARRAPAPAPVEAAGSGPAARP